MGDVRTVTQSHGAYAGQNYGGRGIEPEAERASVETKAEQSHHQVNGSVVNS